MKPTQLAVMLGLAGCTIVALLGTFLFGIFHREAEAVIFGIYGVACLVSSWWVKLRPQSRPGKVLAIALCGFMGFILLTAGGPFGNAFQALQHV